MKLNLFILFLLISLATFSQINYNNYLIKDSVIIKLPDGGNVSATVIAKKNVKQPCILIYNIYATDLPLDSNIIKYLIYQKVNKGYSLVEVNARGKKYSSSELKPFENDGDDVFNIIDWISKQSWCNGKVGMMGGSYLGFAQWAATKKIHPALKTIIPQASVGAGIDFPIQNGVFTSYMIRWIQYVTSNKFTNDSDFYNTVKWKNVYNTYYKNGLKFSDLDSIANFKSPIFQKWLKHSTYDDYWKNMTPQNIEFSKINIPILTVTGYWDDDQLGAMYYYKKHIINNIKANHYLVIGPYDHSGSQGVFRDTLLGLPIDSVADIQLPKLFDNWFNYILQDSCRPDFLSNKVNFEILGSNTWKHVSTIDDMYNKKIKMFLNNGDLQIKKPINKSFDLQVINFKERTFTKPYGEEISAFDRLLIDSLIYSKDEILFKSQPIDIPFALTSNLEATLHCSINKKDFDIVLSLYEQLPSGKYVALSQNIQRASMLNNKSERKLLKPNSHIKIILKNTFINCKQINKGSKLVVLLGALKRPDWQINYGTGKDVSQENISDANEPLKIKWYNDSNIVFKILQFGQ